jgi:hypothetical protein
MNQHGVPILGRQTAVFMGIATKAGYAHAYCAEAVERVKYEAARHGIPVSHRLEFRGDVCIARGLLVQRFLDQPQFSHFLSLDDDVAGYTGEDLARCARSGHDVLGGVLPAKQFDPHSLAEAVRRGVPMDELVQYLSIPLVWAEPGDAIRIDGDFVGPVRAASLGWMLFTRRAIEKLVARLPEKERACRYDPDVYPRLFRFTEDDEGRTVDDTGYVAKLWQDAGGEVWVDTRMRLAHFGIHPFLAAPLLERWGLGNSPEARHPRATPPEPR